MAIQNAKAAKDGNLSLNKTYTAENSSPPSIWFSKRMLVAVMVFLCFANVAMIMNNLNIVVVEMTSKKIVTIGGNTTAVRPAEFQWDTVTIGTISSSFWYGSIFACFSGYIVDKLGGSVSTAMCMTVAGIFTILHPASIYLDFNVFLVCRFMTGFFGNSFYICAAEIYSRWYPKKERSTLTGIGYNGINVGMAISFPLFGFIAEKWSWQTAFYISGGVSIFLGFLCFNIIKNQPIQDEFISEEELYYILDGTDDNLRKREPHPFKKIFLSGPVFALCVGKTTTLWIVTVLAWSLPLYIQDLTDKSTTEIGIISSIPTIIQIIIHPIAGILLDAWSNTSAMKLTPIHKIAVSSVFLLSSICLLTSIFFNDFTISICLIVLATVIGSSGPLVFEQIGVNLSSNDCTVICGLTKICSSIGSIVARTSLGYMTTHHTAQEWNNCFLLTVGVSILGTVLFAIFSSSEAQTWSSTSSFLLEHRPLLKNQYRRKSSS